VGPSLTENDCLAMHETVSRVDVPDVDDSAWPWRSSVLWLGWLLVTVVLGAAYIRLPPSPDQSIFDYIGWIVCNGGTAYVDAADQNWPGKMLIHTASTWLFGNNLWSFRALDYLWLLLTCWFLHRVMRTWFDGSTAFVVIVLYQSMYVTSGAWFAGQRDIVAAPLVLAAGFCALKAMRSRRSSWWIMEAACLCMAVLIRPTFALSGPAFMMLDLVFSGKGHRCWWRIILDHALVGVVLVGLLAVSLWVIYPGDALQEWFDVAILFNLEADAWETGRRSLWDSTAGLGRAIVYWWHWYALLSIAGAFLYWRADRRPELGLLLTIAAVTIASVLSQGQDTTYHLGPLILVFALLMAPVVSGSLQVILSRTMDRRLRLVCSSGVLFLALIGTATKIHGTLGDSVGWYLGRVSQETLLGKYSASGNGDYLTVQDAVDLADYVQQQVPEGKSVLLWGSCTLVNYLAARPAPIRLISFSLVSSVTTRFSLYHDWDAEVRSELTGKPPEMILLVRDAEHPGHHLFMSEDSLGPGYGRHVKKLVDERYKLEKSMGGVDLFRLTVR
jgi:Dolichyl-phosphate-mannose-protein mannosyltransferase